MLLIIITSVGSFTKSMDRLKERRAIRQAQNTPVMNEATAVIATADLVSLTSPLERLTTSNNELRQINNEIEDHIGGDDLVAEYTTVVEHDNEATRVMSFAE